MSDSIYLIIWKLKTYFHQERELKYENLVHFILIYQMRVKRTLNHGVDTVVQT